MGHLAAAAAVATFVAVVGLFAFGRVNWPAFNSSNVTQAITTVGQVVTLAGIAGAVLLIRAHRAPWVARILSWASLSGFVTVTLGMPLAATKLYLHGISVDQEFRTQYLTRLTDSAALRDMNYADLPPYYPAGWFWIGGRVANVFGLDGWEAFKPYAIGSLAVAAVVGLVLWTELVRHDWAVLAATATAALTVTYASPEAYGAVIILLAGPGLLLAWGALHRRDPRAGWGAVVGTGLFLGLAATFYTLYLGWAAFTVVLMALLAAWLSVRETRSWRAILVPALRLVVIAAISGLLALVVWLPYLLEALRGGTATSGTATHYLPESGAVLPLPMVHFSLTGALCLLGTLWLVSRAWSSRRAQALGVGVVAIYLWCLLSMAFTVAGGTLLSFRLEPVLIALLGAAGVFGFIEFAGWIVLATSENPRVKAALVAVGVVGALAFVQDTPRFLAPDITIAYTDTDGDGVRADQRPPGAASYYRDVDAILQQQIPRPRDETVVLTADTSFLSYHPYLGFQALTSHYANPLADFAGRAAAIGEWSELESTDELVDALDSLPWRAPDAFVFRRSPEGYTLRLAEDVYPNDPNVRRYTVTFDERLFDGPRFTVTETGPFVVVTRE
ncbi:arabinofuranosyltransferase [Rhodococcus triatomae]|uniref:Galactan 5-O-arabinofuranosyltransferase n=1 Tax=Rhodococcus triatomae TaxID=300028 RepID=A0A1G8I091_9NOCA|nr:galactan 5-O-arabinofuranosyltransferase [Rhodococcus triatomae]QNG21620.1 arabinofuranosyltransferase [Rhodococcus triatomae]QNG25641.1 arabinofuranosyltransferase [Rhodococcus triatomae]SDI12366.1 galactan 5-O-arabinofuranosyltransferase [Rhodococcus triatomae]